MESLSCQNRLGIKGLAATVNLLITGDEDLLVLDPWHGIRIVTPTDFGTLMEDVGKR